MFQPVLLQLPPGEYHPGPGRCHRVFVFKQRNGDPGVYPLVALPENGLVMVAHFRPGQG